MTAIHIKNSIQERWCHSSSRQTSHSGFRSTEI